MKKGNFWSRYRAAFDAGLNSEWCLKVAYGCIELDAALGEMDHQSECVAIGNNPSVTLVDDYDCGCRGSASCKHCIPF